MSVFVKPGTSLTLTLSRRERGYVASPGFLNENAHPSSKGHRSIVTPASACPLSRRERGYVVSPGSLNEKAHPPSKGHRSIVTLASVCLPLPVGEGWGEGEVTLPCSDLIVLAMKGVA